MPVHKFFGCLTRLSAVKRIFANLHQYISMKNLFSLFLFLFIGSSAAVAQSQADSALLLDKTLWHTVARLPDSVHVSQALFPSLCGNPQALSVIEVPANATRNLRIVASVAPESAHDVARRQGAIAAINGSYFDMTEGNSVCFQKIGAHTTDSTSMKGIVNGAIMCSTHSGPLVITAWDYEKERNYADTLGQVLVTGPLLVIDGNRLTPENVCPEAFALRTHPRTAIGLRADGSTILLTADGRHPEHATGLTLSQLAWIMQMLGCTDAINLDGGGSTCMWIEPGGVVNHPSDNRAFDHLGVRPVPNVIALFPD